MNFVISFMKTITLSFDVSAKITGNNRKKSMDTDELSEMAYQTLVLASQASDYLKAEIGTLSRKFENEDDYLNGVLRFVRIIKADPGGYLDYSDPANPVFTRLGTYGDITSAYGTRIIKVSLRLTF